MKHALSLAAILCCGLQGQDQLRYRAKLHLTDMESPVEARFTLKLLPIARTANRVKKPRLAPWRLELTQAPPNMSPALFLKRMEGFMYFDGPGPKTISQNIVLKYSNRSCRVWSVKMPPNLNAYAYLAEVSPKRHALAYLSGSFGKGGIQSIEIQLESFQLSSKVPSLEGGKRLLQTLKRMEQPSEIHIDEPEYISE